jgi:hypothetical protein
MEDEQMLQRFLYTQIGGKREVGRPKSRRLHEVNYGARKEGMRMRWRRTVSGER